MDAIHKGVSVYLTFSAITILYHALVNKYASIHISMSSRKSIEEHQAQVAVMDKEKRQMEEAVAKSLDDQRRLEAQREDQRKQLVEHFKSRVTTKTVDITAPSQEAGNYATVQRFSLPNVLNHIF